jgi:hypothetical protein
MISPSNSFNKFNYGLRHSKLVERKIMIELLLQLFRARYDIPSYGYFGFGSPFYVDFIMFHKHLYMHDMTCVEWGDIPKRMKFNKPYEFIKLKMGPVNTFFPLLAPENQYLVWLDYDRPLDNDMFMDLSNVFTRLSPGSVFVISVECRARPVDDDIDVDSMSQLEKDTLMVERYKEWFSDYVEEPIDFGTIGEQVIHLMYWEVFTVLAKERLTTKDLKLTQLMHYWYKDGAPMLTIGGMITNVDDRKRLRDNDILNHKYVVRGKNPMIISVPPLTLREKLTLDQIVPPITKKKVKIELSKAFLKNYEKFYREYPTFAEAIM